MNYEYERQNNLHGTENCAGITMDYAYETGNNEPLRLNYAQFREDNTHAKEKKMHIYLNNNQ